MKIVSAGTNPVQLTRGMEKTVAHLVKELKGLSVAVQSDRDLANVASVSAGVWGHVWGCGWVGGPPGRELKGSTERKGPG